MVRNILIGTRLNKTEHQQFSEAIQHSKYLTMSDFIRTHILELIGSTPLLKTVPIKPNEPKRKVSMSMPVELDSLVQAKARELGLNYSETVVMLLSKVVVDETIKR